MQFSQNRLWQQLVSTASLNISKQIGQIHLSSDRLDAEKYENLLGPTLTEELELLLSTSF